MKHSISFRGLILTILLTCCNAVWAYDIEVDGIYYNITSLTDLTAEVTKGDNGYSGDIIIPSTITYKSKTLTVTSIGDRAFRDCFGLTSIVIPNSVTSIGEYAFYGCSNLTSVVIPNSVTNIGEKAFYHCSSLGSVVIPNTVTYIGNWAFYGCDNISEVHINSLTAWCNIEFYYATSNPLYYAGNLYLNGELVTELIIPDDVTEIKNYAFYCCESITSVVIPNSVTSIGVGAFLECKALEYIYVMTETPPSVKNDTFTSKNYIYVILYVPTGCLEAYQNTDVWKEFWEIKEFDTTGISDVKTENKKETTIYDINGRVVDNPANGIYIVDGKKVLLR